MSSWADVWTEEVDEETGAYYYYNSVTGASQWERPVDFVEIVPETSAVNASLVAVSEAKGTPVAR